MTKLAKRLFLIVGCIMPIFIGTLHSVTHFRELVTPEIHQYLQKGISVLGQDQPIWNTWGIVSFMMGVSFIVIGLLNISILKIVPKERSLPALPILAMILFQICVTYAGYLYNSGFQLYGGIFGLAIMLTCLVLNSKNHNTL